VSAIIRTKPRTELSNPNPRMAPSAGFLRLCSFAAYILNYGKSPLLAINAYTRNFAGVLPFNALCGRGGCFEEGVVNWFDGFVLTRDVDGVMAAATYKWFALPLFGVEDKLL